MAAARTLLVFRAREGVCVCARALARGGFGVCVCVCGGGRGVFEEMTRVLKILLRGSQINAGVKCRAIENFDDSASHTVRR